MVKSTNKAHYPKEAYWTRIDCKHKMRVFLTKLGGY